MGPESGYIYQGLIYCRPHILAHQSSCQPCVASSFHSPTHAWAKSVSVLSSSSELDGWWSSGGRRVRNLGYYYFLRPNEHWKTWTLGKLSLSSSSTFLCVLFFGISGTRIWQNHSSHIVTTKLYESASSSPPSPLRLWQQWSRWLWRWWCERWPRDRVRSLWTISQLLNPIEDFSDFLNLSVIGKVSAVYLSPFPSPKKYLILKGKGI